MNQRHRVAFVALLAFLALAIASTVPAVAQDDCSYPYETTDATGENMTLEEPADTVVTLTPGATQTLIEMNETDRIVGTETNSKRAYPEVEDVPDVVTEYEADGTFGDGTAENIIELDPDIVIGSLIYNDPIVDTLRDANITVHSYGDALSIRDIYDKTRVKGRLIGSCASAEGVVDDMQHDIEVINTAVEDETPEPTFYFGGKYSGSTSTTTDGSFVHDLLADSGADNVFDGYEHPTRPWIMLGEEELTVALNENDPDWIVYPDTVAFDGSTQPYNDTNAVERDQVLSVDGDHLQQAAPRVVEPMSKIASNLHPAAYDRAEIVVEGDEQDDSGGVSMPTPPEEESGEDVV
ncbi:MAG: ABC transporter substrate-binding protein, partial [Halobacteriota archaeon]